MEYIAEVLIHLNPDLTEIKFVSLMCDLGDRGNGHVIRTYSDERISDMCHQVFHNRKKPYCRRPRKVLFNPGRVIPLEEKRMIIGAVIGNRVGEEVIYEIIEELMETAEKITISLIAERLNSSRKTISKNITKGLRDVIEHHNKSIKLENDTKQLISIIEELTDSGENDIKIRALKQLTSIRDYSLIKKTISNYFDN